MPETSIGGALVPSVKADSETPAEEEVFGAGKVAGAGCSGDSEVDRDLVCPICMQVIKDAFLTACGHSYCYMCVATHLRNRNDCPCCGRYLTPNLIFPNFAVDKLLKKIPQRQFTKSASYTEQLYQALNRQDCEISVKELDSLLCLLAEKKRKMEQEEAETNLKILLEFLVCLRKKKMEMLNEIQKDLQYIKEDINAVQKRKLDLLNVNNRYMLRSTAANDVARRGMWRAVARPDDFSTPEPVTSGSPLEGEGNVNPPVHCQTLSENDVNAKSESQHLVYSEKFMARKRQIQEQFNDLQECYLQKRRHWAKQSQELEARDLNDAGSSYYHQGLEDFQSVLSSVTRYSIEFDRDDELFATAGVSRQIKVFELSSVMNEPAQVHCAVVDIATRSKLSCLSWNKYTKHYIASSDYDGIVTVWDITTRQSVREYEEHEKRAWSVDFSRTEPSLLLSGGDDCKVKVWCTKQEDSVLNINMNANICSVKCNPGSSMHVAVGSADHHIHYYDLRNVSQPLHVFSGHRKTVSYVKFLSSHELASASTDSTLRLWDVKENLPIRIYRGHMNEKNFVGLTANSEYLSCGSETNEVFVYHKVIQADPELLSHYLLLHSSVLKAKDTSSYILLIIQVWVSLSHTQGISKPVARYRFNASEFDEIDEDRGSFISAVCWKGDSPIILAANSQGTIKVLALAL
ncbi:hypothetical protein Cgig2_027636 [Carnegiea gigantea]|uniref:RING-type domain-containing protein n=1 Tax=Carnegiea gigantea TaxID=171969 RepID=A0A9Q1JP70_9CARY|nr:hypothetical protein Cgig2_027636 [Carnegiea gigantea]